MALISKKPRMARLVAAGEVRTLCIEQKQFEGILRERPETSLVVMRDLCDRLRDYLESSEAPISEIAYLAGFSEPSAFSRAVTRWFGRSPIRLRQESELRVA